MKHVAISMQEMLTISKDEVLRRLEKAGFNVRLPIQYSDVTGEMVYTQDGKCHCEEHRPLGTELEK